MAITVEGRTQVSQLYTALFGRAPDIDGLVFWATALGDGASLTTVADAMYDTAPARAYYPANATHVQIISSFYLNVLGRPADFDGLVFWSAKLGAGMTPGAVIAAMIANVATYQGTDPAGLTSQALFDNRVAVAQHYAEAGGGVDGATTILSTVTADPATALAAIAAIDGHGGPVFSAATVNGTTLVMSYTDDGALDASHVPAASAFAVTVAGAARAVTAVAVDAAAKTVTLTLASTVTNGQAVTVAYTDPTTGNDANAIQDADGNDAATLAAHAVTNTTSADVTAPVFVAASVSGASLVMVYTDASALDAAHPPLASAFTVMVAGVARSVTAVAVDASAKTVTLTLASEVAGGQAVTVAYADPTTGNDTNAIQDAGGNDAATLAATAVTNPAADVTGPLFAGATVSGTTLVMSYTDTTMDSVNVPLASAFTVKVGGVIRAVNSVSVSAADHTVSLTLASPVADGDTVTVAYKDPTSGDDAAAIQDFYGNDAATLPATAVTNITPDVIAPVFASAAVTGNHLVLTYTDLNSLNSVNLPAASAFAVKVDGVARTVNSVAVDGSAMTVTLTLASAVTNGQAVTVAYTDPTAGNDLHAIQDVAGNDAASFAATPVTNSTPDTTPPVFASAAVNGATLVMTYTELNALDDVHVPATGAFSVNVAGVGRAVTGVAVDANAHTVTLTLASAVANGQAVTVAYTDPTGANDTNAIQDASGNDAATLVAHAVTNNTPDTTPPVFSTAAVNGNTLVMNYTELNLLDAVNAPGNGDFTVMLNGGADAVTGVVVNAGAHTVTLTLTTAAVHGDTVTVGYADPTVGDDVNAIQDASGNDAATIVGQAATNNTP